jgi:hypothetical protein
VLAHPDRVSAAVASSAGWYTFPDLSADYPYGLDDIGELKDVRFEPDRFLKIPVLVIVGSQDLARGDSLRREIRVDRNQGRTRLERAQRWTEAMNQLARERGLPPPVTLDVVLGVKHSLRDHVEAGRLPERAFDFLFSPDRPGA